jgi:hypothetical protein
MAFAWPKNSVTFLSTEIEGAAHAISRTGWTLTGWTLDVGLDVHRAASVPAPGHSGQVLRAVGGSDVFCAVGSMMCP